MVEYTLSLDSIFSALADPTRRDILRRISYKELTVGEIAQPYDLTFAAISKHLKVLEKAKMVVKKRRGKEQIVYISSLALKEAEDYLDYYRQLWETRLDSLEDYLKKSKE
jgi:DNA-binding transcriptional ArsR family regulator